jgi:hypothetical protein
MRSFLNSNKYSSCRFVFTVTEFHESEEKNHVGSDETQVGFNRYARFEIGSRRGAAAVDSLCEHSFSLGCQQSNVQPGVLCWSSASRGWVVHEWFMPCKPSGAWPRKSHAPPIAGFKN